MINNKLAIDCTNSMNNLLFQEFFHDNKGYNITSDDLYLFLIIHITIFVQGTCIYI